MTSSPSARFFLRDATAECHAAVDRIYGLLNLGVAADYRRFLCAHARALLPVEDWLDAHAPGIVDDWPRRSRRAALTRDLATLGFAVEQWAMPADAPFGSQAAIAGVLYVVEGSKLGGRLLLRQVAADLPRDYLSAGTEGGDWREFSTRLDRLVATEADRATAKRAALWTFARFQRAGVDVLLESDCAANVMGDNRC